MTQNHLTRQLCSQLYESRDKLSGKQKNALESWKLAEQYRQSKGSPSIPPELAGYFKKMKKARKNDYMKVLGELGITIATVTLSVVVLMISPIYCWLVLIVGMVCSWFLVQKCFSSSNQE